MKKVCIGPCNSTDNEVEPEEVEHLPSRSSLKYIDFNAYCLVGDLYPQQEQH